MTMEIGVGGAHKFVSKMWVGVGGANKIVPLAWVGVGGQWKLAFAALTASATNVSGYAEGSGGPGVVVSDPTSVTVNNGSGNYSYAWSKVSGEDFSRGGPDHAPYWFATLNDGTHYANWKVVVTDLTYGVSAEATMTINLTWTNLN